MTPEQAAMFQLHDSSPPGQPTPQQMIQAEPEIDEVNQSLAQVAAYMAQNGPIRPLHRGRAKMMTRTQLEEQKMNEAAGLPSNLDEAARVVALEQRIQNVDAKLDQIIGAIRPPRMVESDVFEDWDPKSRAAAPPPTPPVRPAVEPPPVQPGQLRYHPPQPSTEVAPPTVTQIPEVQELPPDTCPQTSQPPASQETAPPSPLSLGPVGSQGYDPGPMMVSPDPASVADPEGYRKRHHLPSQPDEALVPGEDIIETPSSPGEEGFDVEALIEEDGPVVDETDPVELERLKHLGRQQILTDQVSTWLKTKDPHKFWRRFLASACNKNLSYNAWPAEFQASFNDRFKQMIEDPTFVSTLCGRILKFQNGPLVAPHVAGAFIVVIAGMLSFALLEG